MALSPTPGTAEVVPAAAPELRGPMDGSGIALVILAVIAVTFALHWARAVLIPLMLGVMISYALSAPVDLMQRWHIPRAIGAALLLLAIMGSIATGAYSLGDDAGELIESLPEAARMLRVRLVDGHGTSDGTLNQVQRAATQLKQVATETGAAAEVIVPSGVTRVQVEKPALDIMDYLWMGTKGAFGITGQIAMVIFLAYFTIVSGDTYRRKIVSIAGPTLGRKKVTLKVLDEISGQIRRYLLVQILTSLLVGVATWLALLWIGLEHAAIWGIAAAVFNTIPYLGPVIVTGATALVALVQFGTLTMALVTGGTSLLITGIEGYLLLPWLTGRASRMNPLVVLVGVVFWGWLWGVWGLLLGVPIIMIVKSVCDRVEDLKPVGELLGD